MDIACPQCAAAYEIDDATVGAAGRKVRCAACGMVWRVEPPPSNATLATEREPPQETREGLAEELQAADASIDGDPAAIESLPDEPAAEPPPAAETNPPPRRARWVKGSGKRAPEQPLWRRVLSWRTAAIAACVALVAGGLHQRESVVRLLPQTARIYAAIGMPVNLRGIAIRNVASRVVADGEDPVLVVDGDLVNVTDRKVDVPRLYFTVLGKDGQPLYAWSAQADRATLQPGETLNFRRRLAAPPQDGKDVKVRFLTRSDITAGIK